jgi:CRISPR-associated protein Cmr5
MSNDRPTLDQRRAQHAWNTVEKALSLGAKGEKDTFARETKQLPMRIKTAGLGQALAFLRAKAKAKDQDGDARKLLLGQLGNWVLDERDLASRPQDTDKDSALIKAIIRGNADLLRRATEEALLYLQWLTRFCEAELGTGED